MGAAESSKKLRDNVQRVAENDRTYVEVNCENSSAGDRGAVALAEALRTNTRARLLKLGGCDISHVGAQALVDSLSNPLKKSRLRRLEFSTASVPHQRGNPLGNAGAVCLAQILKNKTTITLQHLVINKCGISDEGATALAEALQTNTRLLTLELGENCISDKGAESIGRCLSNNSTLIGLSLWHNRIFAEGAEALAKGLKENSTIEWLGLGCNHIGDIGASAIAEALLSNANESHLKWLALGGNGISDRAVNSLAEMLQGKTKTEEDVEAKVCKLESLGLGGNAISDVGAKKIAQALRKNTTLKSLGLADNRIGDEGAVVLASSLLESETLEKLIVSGNEIRNDGASQLAAALAKNQSLRSLFIAENDFTDEAGKRFVEVLAKHNSTLRKLDVHNSAMTEEGMQELVNSLQDTGLTSLGGEITKKRAKADRNDALRKSKSGNIMPITARQEEELPTKAGSIVFRSPTSSWGQSARAMDSLPSSETKEAAVAAVEAFQAAGQQKLKKLDDDDTMARRKRAVRKAADKFLGLRLLAQQDDEMAIFEKDEMETSFMQEIPSPYKEFDDISGSLSSSSSLSHLTKERPKQKRKRKPSLRSRSVSQSSTDTIPEENEAEDADTKKTPPKKDHTETLTQRYERLKKGESLEEEFRQIIAKDDNHAHDFRTATLPENKFKNHEGLSCLPPEHSRVKLTLIDGAQGSDYINASHVKISNCSTKFIIAQSPLEDTYQDFWRMIWENNVRIIVMLTKTIENGEIKCEEYWPDSSGDGDEYGLAAQSYTRGKPARWVPGGLKVVSSPLRNEIVAGVKARDFVLEESRSAESRSVTLYQYAEWPDHGVPKSVLNVADFATLIRNNYKKVSKDQPVLVHGFLGTGRCGSFCCILGALELLENDDRDDVKNGDEFFVDSLLTLMRNQRPCLVETSSQFDFIHRVLYAILFPETAPVEIQEKESEKKKSRRRSWFGGGASDKKKKFSLFGRKTSSTTSKKEISVEKEKPKRNVMLDDGLY